MRWGPFRTPVHTRNTSIHLALSLNGNVIASLLKVGTATLSFSLRPLPPPPPRRHLSLSLFLPPFLSLARSHPFPPLPGGSATLCMNNPFARFTRLHLLAPLPARPRSSE